MNAHFKPDRASAALPTSDEAPAVAAAQGFKTETVDSLDCRATKCPAQPPLRDLVWQAAIGVVMLATALAFLVTVGGRP